MTKWVYSFGPEKTEGKGEMKNLLGGKGANLAEMSSLGLPVPPGFTITTEVCTYFYAHGQRLPGRPQERSARRRSPPSGGRPTGASATLRIRCWSPYARARALRCPA